MPKIPSHNILAHSQMIDSLNAPRVVVFLLWSPSVGLIILSSIVRISLNNVVKCQHPKAQCLQWSQFYLLQKPIDNRTYMNNGQAPSWDIHDAWLPLSLHKRLWSMWQHVRQPLMSCRFTDPIESMHEFQRIDQQWSSWQLYSMLHALINAPQVMNTR